MARNYKRVTVTFQYAPEAFDGDEDDAIESVHGECQGCVRRQPPQHRAGVVQHTTLFDAHKACDNCAEGDSVTGSDYCEDCAFLDDEEEE